MQAVKAMQNGVSEMLDNGISNKDLIIPHYDNEESCQVFPCNTDYMIYNKAEHRYYLTEAGLTKHGVQFSNGDEATMLINTATKHIYKYIQACTFAKYNIMCYRIAKSLFGRDTPKVQGRLEFEEILAEQAQYIAENGDTMNTPKMITNPDNGRMTANKLEFKDGYFLADSVLLWIQSHYLDDINVQGGIFDRSKY